MSTILKELIKDPNLDVTTLSVNLRSTMLKPTHFDTLKKILSFFDTEDGRYYDQLVPGSNSGLLLQ